MYDICIWRDQVILTFGGTGRLTPVIDLLVLQHDEVLHEQELLTLEQEILHLSVRLAFYPVGKLCLFTVWMAMTLTVCATKCEAVPSLLHQ